MQQPDLAKPFSEPASAASARQNISFPKTRTGMHSHLLQAVSERLTAYGLLQEASATNFEFFASDYASQALQGVSTYFYTEAGINPFHDDFAGGTQHPISDPSNAGRGPLVCS